MISLWSVFLLQPKRKRFTISHETQKDLPLATLNFLRIFNVRRLNIFHNLVLILHMNISTSYEFSNQIHNWQIEWTRCIRNNFFRILHVLNSIWKKTIILYESASYSFQNSYIKYLKKERVLGSWRVFGFDLTID